MKILTLTDFNVLCYEMGEDMEEMFKSCVEIIQRNADVTDLGTLFVNFLNRYSDEKRRAMALIGIFKIGQKYHQLMEKEDGGETKNERPEKKISA